MVKLKVARDRLGLSPNTLRRMADDGEIPSIRTAHGQRLFDVDAYLKTAGRVSTLCYARVSSHKQRDDLNRQVERLQTQFPQAEIVKDIGSGLNFRRKGLHTLLERLLRGDKLQVVVTHRDRLARFGVDVFRFLIEQNGGELLVLDPYVATAASELTADLLAILHHFSCRMHGMRSHRCAESGDQTDSRTESAVQDLVQRLALRVQQDSGTTEWSEGTAAGALDEGSAPDFA